MCKDLTDLIVSGKRYLKSHGDINQFLVVYAYMHVLYCMSMLRIIIMTNNVNEYITVYEFRINFVTCIKNLVI